jgi:hypothetical protein
MSLFLASIALGISQAKYFGMLVDGIQEKRGQPEPVGVKLSAKAARHEET